MAGASQIGNLNVRLAIDTAQFIEGLTRSQVALGRLGKSIKSFAAATSGLLAFGGVTAVLKSAANRMDDLGKAAQRIGIPVAELSKLEYAARLADVSLEDLSTGTAKFSKALAEIAAGGKNSASAALDALGISAVDSNGKLRPTIEIYGDIADKFQNMQDGAGKTAISLALIPKSGAALIPFFNGGREAIKAAGDELERFGGVVTPEAAKRAEQFNDNLTRLQQAADGITQQIAEAMLPAMIDLTESFLKFLNTGTPVVDMVESLKNWFAELAPFIKTTRKEFEMLSDTYDKFLSYIGSSPTEINIGTRYDPLSSINAPKPPERKKQDAPTLNLGNGEKKPSWMTGRSESPSQGGDVTGFDLRGNGLVIDQFATDLQDANTAAQDLASSITDTLGSAISGLASGTLSFKDAFSEMAGSLISDLADISAQLLKSGLFKLLGNFGGSFGAMGLGGFGGFYASGGTLGAGKWGIAGEAGPEIVRGPASISPMGAGGSTTVNVYNQGGGDVSTRKRKDGSGREIIDVMVGVARQTVAKDSKRLLGAGFGVSPALTPR